MQADNHLATIAALQNQLALHVQELETTRAFLLTVLISAPSAIWVTDDFTSDEFSLINDKAVAITGYSLSDTPTVTEWFNAVFPDPDYRAEVSEIWMTAILSGVRDAPAFRLRCQDGSDKWLEFRYQAVPGGNLIIFGDDITEKLLARREIEEKLAFIQTLIDTIPYPIFYKDEEGRFLGLNRAYEVTLKVDRNQLLGKTLLELEAVPSPETLALHQAQMRLIAQGGCHHQETVLTFGDGKSHDVLSWLCTFHRSDSSCAGLIGTFVDISEHKEMERRADAANQAKSIFLASMSHEIRTPMNAILGYSQILQNAGLPAEQQRSVAAILSAGAHLLELINNVLDLSKIEAGKTALNLAPTELRVILADVETIFTHKMLSKDLKLSFAIAPEVPSCVLADAPKIRQILLNLLSNAWKFTRVGGIEVELRSRPGDSAGDLVIELKVCDSGCGIAAAELDRIFGAFEQSSAGIDDGSGTGLGLAISRNFARLMGGDLTVSSRLGHGATFTFSFLAHPSFAPQNASSEVSRRLGPLEAGQGEIRLLIVDDVADNRAIARGLLAPIGFSLREAKNGLEALDLCAQWQPQIILMDIFMPVMDGIEATRLLRQRPEGKNACIIALTASVLSVDRDKVLASGVNDFHRKPWLLHELIAVIAEHSSCRFTVAAIDEAVAVPAAAIKHQNFLALPPDLGQAFALVIKLGDLHALSAFAADLRPHDAALADLVLQCADNFDLTPLLHLLAPPEMPET